MRRNLFLLTFVLSVAGAGAAQLTTWGTAQQPVLNLADVKQISSAVDHSVALRADGTVACWGYNFAYQCNVPGGLSAVQSVAAGEFFSVAARSNGTVIAWGDNTLGQRDVPQSLSGVKAVSAGHGHCLALRNDGTIVAWGDNDYGQTNVPPGIGTATAVRAAGNFSVALRSGGSVVAWGDNNAGQTNVPAGLSGVTAIDASLTYCLARKSDGTVVMWGRGPALPGDLTQVTAIAAGEDHALAVKSDGSVVAWGFNDGGQLNVPASIASASAVSAAWHFSAALTGDSPALFYALNPSWNNGVFTVSVPTQTGFSYRLEYKNSLSDTGWSSGQTVSGTGGPVTLTDSTATNSRRSYRIVRF